ncbi:MAG: hypothetical protein HY699_10785 [Deltaproteobacteria bacterium]|nr:hypothetical protein [Deltaproteobacteria bacterium]
MIRRRAKHADIKTTIGCHTFCSTGIAAYLENGGTLEHAQQVCPPGVDPDCRLLDEASGL